MARRVLPSILVIALLAATAAAFALTERAKLERSPVYGTQQSQVFSPDSKDPAKKVAHIRFHVRKSESIDVWIQDSDGEKVDSLLVHRDVRPSALVQLVWDAFTPSGVGVPDGTYRAVVKLERSHRTIVCRATSRSTRRRRTSRHDRRRSTRSSRPTATVTRTSFRIPYEVSEPAHAILLLRGKQVVFTNGQKEKGELVWNGKAEGRRLDAATAAGPLRALDRRAGPRRQPSTGRAVRDRAGPLSSRSRGRVSSFAPAAGSRCASRPTRRRSTGVSTAAHGDAAARDAAPARAEVGRRLPPLRLRREPLRRRARWWSRERRSRAARGSGRGARARRLLIAAHAARPADRRARRLGVGCAGLVVYLAPHGHHRAARGCGRARR